MSCMMEILLLTYQLQVWYFLLQIPYNLDVRYTISDSSAKMPIAHIFVPSIEFVSNIILLY